jgi:hypothetical protein
MYFFIKIPTDSLKKKSQTQQSLGFFMIIKTKANLKKYTLIQIAFAI